MAKYNSQIIEGCGKQKQDNYNEVRILNLNDVGNLLVPQPNAIKTTNTFKMQLDYNKVTIAKSLNHLIIYPNALSRTETSPILC